MIDKNNLQKELHKFFRLIKLRAHFGNNEQKEKEKTEEDIFRPASTWEPKQVHHTVDTFCEAVLKETEQKAKKHSSQNLSKDEIKALNELETRDDIVITKADKGGAVVIMDVDSYIKEAQRQLENEESYNKLPNDPTKVHAEQINKTIERFKNEGLITEKVAKGLHCHEPKTPKFSLLPKIHKESIPGRPVIDSVNCHSTQISKYVDYHLQPEVVKLKSYTKDSTDTINKLSKIQDQVSENDILVSMDVRSLYTNIPNGEGIQAVRDALNASATRLPTRIITTFLLLILTLNNFIFNGINYIQRMGCAMGTKCAPSYANLFMGKFEDLYIYPRLLNKSRIYLRYIDDLFFIWTGTEQELKTFFQQINKVHRTIKFDYEFSKKEINFLDLTIYKDNKGKLATKVYTKPTDRQSYLYRTSAHPEHLKKSIPYGQALRLRRICTEESEFDKACNQLSNKLKNRGYKEEEINTQINKAKLQDRNTLLKYKEKSPMNRIPCVVTYNRRLPNIKDAIHKHWDLLKLNEKLEPAFQEKPFMAFKRSKNLRDLIGQKTIVNGRLQRRKNVRDQKGWCSPCNSHGNNLCCRHVRNTNQFVSNITRETYKIHHRVNCRSKFVIYLMECIKCKIQYIGKSEPTMNIRINKHRDDVTREDAIQVCQHFNQTSHNFEDHARFTIIETLKDQNKDLVTKRRTLEDREDFWIKKLKTLTPNGFNQTLNRN